MKFFTTRKRESHKGDYGSVFIVAGSKLYAGAPVLAANAAIKSGAGLVYLAVPSEIYNVVSARVLPEIIVVPMSGSKNGVFEVKAADEIESFVRKHKIDSIVFGPGLTTARTIKEILKNILSFFQGPLIIDADGINVLDTSAKLKSTVIVTPHPGEASRLLGISVDNIQKNRTQSAKKISQKFGSICVLKGNRTVVTDGNNVFINSTGNPGMATAGSGDVLSGMMGAIVNQISPLFKAVVATVSLHGLAGDVAAQKNTEVSMTSSDIIANIPEAVKKFGNG